MLEGITFGQYIPGQSVIHRLDPRTKIFCALVFVAATLLARSWAAYALLTGLALFFICLSRVPWRLVGKTLKPFWPIIILTFLLQVFFTPGQAVFCTGVFQVTAEGIEAGGQLFWRLTVIVIVTSLLTLTTSPLDLTAAVEGLLAPLARAGLPARELAMMMTLAIRFLPTLLREAFVIMKAQQARGASFHSGWPWERLAKAVPLLVSLFAGALRRAEELAAAMEARCYRVGAARTRMRPLRLGRRDFLAIVVACSLLVVIVIFR